LGDEWADDVGRAAPVRQLTQKSSRERSPRRGSATDVQRIPDGQRVVLQGLSKPELREALGTVKHFDFEKGRYAVTLDRDQSCVLVQDKNLRVSIFC
jgi:hypothetical protein